MCGRISLHEPKEALARRFAVDEVLTEELPLRWNVAPSQPVYAVISSSDGSLRRLASLRWGLVPNWAKDPSMGNRFINARAETADINGAFRSAFERRRCLVPANGFFEWEHPLGPKGRRQRGQPYHARTEDGSVLALGGLWEVWYDAEDVPLRTVTIMTTAANSVIGRIHDRMPVIVDNSMWDVWLAPRPLAETESRTLLAPASNDLLVLDRVSDRVNNTRNDGPELIESIPVDSGVQASGPSSTPTLF